MKRGIPNGTLEVKIRPRPGGTADRTRFRVATGAAASTLAGGGFLFLASQGRGPLLWFLGWIGLLAAAAVVARTTFFAQTSIRVDRDLVRRTGCLGRSASCSRAAIGRVIEISLTAWPAEVGIPAKWLLFLDTHGRPLLRAYAEYYPTAELERLRHALDVPWESRSKIWTFESMRREFPGSFPWVLGHFRLVSLFGVAVLLGVIFVVIAATP